MAEEIRLEGLAELERKLQQLPRAVRDKVARQAVLAGAKIVKEDAKARAPVRTGRLRRNIIVKRSRKEDPGVFAYFVTVRGRGKRKDPKNAHYWWFVERGFRHRGGTVVPARPFLKPAFKANINQAIEKMRERVAAGLKREAKKLGLSYR
jgi:HK97 gp10 family phage protein